MDLNQHTKQTEAIVQLTTLLEEASVPYILKGAASLYAFQVEGVSLETIECDFQWDAVEQVHKIFQPYGATPIDRNEEGASFTAHLGGQSVLLTCQWNHVVRLDPNRLEIPFQGKKVAVQAVSAVIQGRDSGDPLVEAAKTYLETLQSHNTELSREAWNYGTYEAWVKRFGDAQTLGKQVASHPKSKLVTIASYLGEVKGKNVLNLMGSNGIKAVALARLGAQSTVVDLSEESERYARELAEAAGVSLEYVVADVLQLKEDRSWKEKADILFMERGILHYFVDLDPLMEIVFSSLKPGGRFVLQDFHPISTKLIHSKGKKHKVDGNYFEQAIHKTPVATSKYMNENEFATPQYVNQRRWTLGEIVTSVASVGLYIKKLDESPNEKKDDEGLPKLFTLVAEKK
jgi:2-polyprenyl-3-methyl-5-hydroxy-6-metoxy-1,4-benzoquinol methylase